MRKAKDVKYFLQLAIIERIRVNPHTIHLKERWFEELRKATANQIFKNIENYRRSNRK